MLPFPTPLLPAVFIHRENRFRAVVRLDGGNEVVTHVPNSGRLGELLLPGARCFVTPGSRPGKTSHVLRLVDHGGLVSVDARLPNRLFADAWRRGALGWPFASCVDLRNEVRRGDSRLDFLLAGPGGRLWVEVKSVTLLGDPASGIQDGVARFPDAPTARGARHLAALVDAVVGGEQAAVVFVVQRADVLAFMPNHAADPLFSAALRQAAASGVSVHAYRCRVDGGGISIDRALPVIL